MKKRKTKLVFILALILCICSSLFLFGCGEKTPNILPNDQTEQGEDTNKKVTYTISFESNGGSEIAPIVKQAGGVLVFDEPTKNGYTFCGWFLEENFVHENQLSVMPNENIILYAKWEIIEYDINYNLTEDVDNAKNPTRYNVETETITLQDPTREGFVFAGWYKESSFNNAVVNIIKGSTGNQKLYAQWASDLSYIVNGEEYSVEKPNDNMATEVLIPTYYNGKKVTGIEMLAFRLCYNMTSITIPNTIKTIGSRAFEDCSGLKTITIPDSVTTLGDNVFSGCNGISSIVIPSNITKIGSYTFYYCTSLTKITLPKTLKTIEKWAFFGCTNLTSIFIPKSVINIANYAFKDCDKLTIRCERSESERPGGWSTDWNYDKCPVRWGVSY